MFLSLLDLLRQETGRLAPLAPEDAPVVELIDQGDQLLLRARLQEVDPKSVKVQLSESALALGGARTVEERTEGPDGRNFKRSVSQFYREMRLPCRVAPHRAVARWEPGGLLLVTLPKA
ncbi:MAG: Hsp20/alpha crystallin family [Symbiobacteriaceae bacterium]|jgi:HSP20 family molecular chaperone IbpA|nr:Hsp20/alpha crystallin family [Symbiobacteriaceae bacterium]